MTTSVATLGYSAPRVVRAVVALLAAVAGAYAIGSVTRHGASPVHQASPKPCALLTNADVAAAFGGRVAYRTEHPQYHQCTWSGAPFVGRFGQQSVTLSVARASRDVFVKSASSWIAPGSAPGSRRIARSVRVRGVGEIAFTQPAAGYDLEVWDGGVVYDVSSVLLPAPLAAEKRLVRGLIARLHRARGETSAR